MSPMPGRVAQSSPCSDESARHNPPTPKTRHLVEVVVVLLGSIGVLGCGESRPFYYQYYGTLVKADGSPAVGVKLFVTDAEGLRQNQTDDSRWDSWRYFGTVTDPDGQFSGLFNGDEGCYRWLDLVPIPPPAKKLDGVYVFYSRTHCEWESIFVRLDEKSQAHGFAGGRQLVLTRVILPRALASMEQVENKLAPVFPPGAFQTAGNAYQGWDNEQLHSPIVALADCRMSP